MKRIYVLSDGRVGVSEGALYRDVVTDITRRHERFYMRPQASWSYVIYRLSLAECVRRQIETAVLCKARLCDTHVLAENWDEIY